jgi:ectoine hydroxylase-related dioxygenase (phytanoyl-CoA dioxygenase family)
MSKAQPPQLPTLANASETDVLGIIYLQRFWSQKIAAQRQVVPGDITAGDLVAESVLLAGLRLGVRETLDFLMNAVPSFEEFEAWVLAKNGGTIESARVVRLNGALGGCSSFALESIQAEPVLSAADLAFWDEHGYVVVKQAVSADHCRAAVEAIFAHAGMDINRPDSWYADAIWILLAHHPALWANRHSGRIHTAFAQIWKRSDLWMNVDVCGVNPPERPGYQFRGTPLHWDMTLTPPVRLGTQAILYLTDTAANQGAFSCVPGFHRRLETWLRELPAGVDPRTQAVKELRAIPIAGHAGDLIIWHHALPHGATPNRAALPRVVQYLNMFPSQYEINAQWS